MDFTGQSDISHQTSRFCLSTTSSAQVEQRQVFLDQLRGTGAGQAMAYMNMIPEKHQVTAAKPNGVEEHDDPDTSSRPRLTREQVWMLEKQFQIHPKPSSDIKRRLAEEAGLSLPRVANWFQNRRAKAKQQRKQGEFKLLQAASGMTSPTYGDGHGPDIFHPLELPTDLDLTPTWPHGNHLDEQTSGLTSPCQLASPAEIDYGFLTQHPNTSLPYFSDHSGYASFAASETSSPTQENNQLYMRGLSTNHSAPVGFPASAFSDYGSSRNSSVTWTPAQQIDDPFDFAESFPQLEQLGSNPSLSADPVEQDYFTNLHGTSELNQPQQLFHSANLQYQTNPDLLQYHNEQPHHQLIYQNHLPLGQQARQYQSVWTPDGNSDADGAMSMTHADTFSGRSSPSDLISTFSAVGIEHDGALSPPPTQSDMSLDIAARRKRPRPAALGHAALRTHSYAGTTPASPAGKGSFLGPCAPMRRIRSTNNISLLRGRIQKTLPGSAQRSPLPFSTFADAGAFERGYFSGRTPTGSELMSTPTGSFAPPTPRSPTGNGSARAEFGNGSSPLALCHGYSRSAGPTNLDLETSLVSPPSTPLDLELQARFQRYGLDHQSPPQSAGLQMPFGMSEGQITSPTFTSFPATIHMPQPTYMSPIVTGESMGQVKPGANENKPSQTNERSSVGKNNTNNKTGPELLFHQYTPTHKAPPPPRMSPHKPRNYIFTNQGPEDF